MTTYSKPLSLATNAPASAPAPLCVPRDAACGLTHTQPTLCAHSPRFEALDTAVAAASGHGRVKPSEFITTLSGKTLPIDDIMDGKLSDDLIANLIDIDDIGHALSLQCRWTGATPYFYSVAQHSMAVALHTRIAHKTAMTHVQLTTLCLWALLHDAAEAYVGNLSRSVRVLCPAFDKLEAALIDVIMHKFFPSTLMPTLEHLCMVNAADDAVAAREARLFFYSSAPLQQVFATVNATTIDTANFNYREPGLVRERFVTHVMAMSTYLHKVASECTASLGGAK